MSVTRSSRPTLFPAGDLHGPTGPPQDERAPYPRPVPGAAVPLPEARATARAVGLAARLPAEPALLADAVGRVAAEAVTARDRLPRFDASAMDGYALRAADTEAASAARPAALRIVDESRAGRGAGTVVRDGEAVRISTGAPIPTGADAVVRVEDTSADARAVRVGVRVEAGHDVRRAGEDVAPGTVVLPAGRVVRPATVGLLAGLGQASVAVVRRPSVVVVVTGDEVGVDAADPGPGMVRDVCGVVIPALLLAAGAGAVRVARVGDDLDATVDALGDAAADVVVTTGGLSVGRHDHVRRALATVGASERVTRVAARPGGPAWLGALDRDGATTPVVGLPGNPAAAMVMAILLAGPLLGAMAGGPPPTERRARLVGATRRDGRRHRVLWGSLVPDDDGAPRVAPDALQQSHRLRPAADADVLAIVPPGDGPLDDGAVVEIVPVPGAALV